MQSILKKINNWHKCGKEYNLEVPFTSFGVFQIELKKDRRNCWLDVTCNKWVESILDETKFSSFYNEKLFSWKTSEQTSPVFSNPKIIISGEKLQTNQLG